MLSKFNLMAGNSLKPKPSIKKQMKLNCKRWTFDFPGRSRLKGVTNIHYANTQKLSVSSNDVYPTHYINVSTKDKTITASCKAEIRPLPRDLVYLTYDGRDNELAYSVLWIDTRGIVILERSPDMDA